jgi:hypothetical protein
VAQRKRRPTTDAEHHRGAVLQPADPVVQVPDQLGVPPNAFLLQVDNDGRLTATQTTTGVVTVVALP